MHDADRSAALAALKKQLNCFEDLGLERMAALSIREYLARLASAGVVDSATATQVAVVYDRCRFGKGCVAPDQVEAAIVALKAGVGRLESLDDEARAALNAPLSRGARPRSGRRLPVGPRPGHGSNPRTASTSKRDAAQLASRRKRRLERGPSRLWTFIACGLMVWTLAVMAGSLWQHHRIERLLGSSEWGRPLISRLRGEKQEQSELRRRVEEDKHSATAHDFTRLAEQYLNRRNYAEAIHAYQQGLARSSDSQKAEMLNNLAWMLLTADDPWYCDPVQAQQLAEGALELHKAPEYYDTLAVAYLQNGKHFLAIDMEKRALELAKKESVGDQRYYFQKLQEFQRAAKAFEISQPIARP